MNVAINNYIHILLYEKIFIFDNQVRTKILSVSPAKKKTKKMKNPAPRKDPRVPPAIS